MLALVKGSEKVGEIAGGGPEKKWLMAMETVVRELGSEL